jgi:hypothetical protein
LEDHRVGVSLHEARRIHQKLKKENATPEGMVQSRNEPIMEIATETGLNRMVEDNNEDNYEDENEDDDGDRRDAATPCAAAPPPVAMPPTDAAHVAAAPEINAKEEEDLKMMIPE